MSYAHLSHNLATLRERFIRYLPATLIAVVAYASILPTLGWIEIHGVERYGVVTAVETIRFDRWLRPTMEGLPRLRKPPLGAWLIAAGMSKQIVAATESHDLATRSAAYRRLQFEARWVVAGLFCLTALPLYELTRLLAVKGAAHEVGGVALSTAPAQTTAHHAGLIAAATFFSTVFYLLISRETLIDVPLMFFATAAHAAFAHVFFKRRVMRGSAAAGLFVGLGFLTKGPVAVLMTVAPWAGWWLWTRRHRPRIASTRKTLAALGIGGAIFLVVGCSWYAWIAATTPDIWHLWRIEAFRSDPNEREDTSPLNYVAYVALLLPCTPALLAAFVSAFRREAIGGASSNSLNASRDARRLLVVLIVLPVIVMMGFRDRKSRYLLPLLAPGCALAAVEIARPGRRRVATADAPASETSLPDETLASIDWAAIQLVLLGSTVAGFTVFASVPLINRVPWAAGIHTLDGRPWFSPLVATGLVAAMTATVAIGLRFRRQPLAVALVTAAAMLVFRPAYYAGASRAIDGFSDTRPLAEAIRTLRPEAQVYRLRKAADNKSPPPDFSIYLAGVVKEVDTIANVPADDSRAVFIQYRRRRQDQAGEPYGRAGNCSRNAHAAAEIVGSRWSGFVKHLV